MGYENDFVNETPVEFFLGDKRFVYKPMTAEEESNLLNVVLYYDEESGKNKTDYSKLNKEKLKNILEVPYTKLEIKNILGLDKDWKDISQDLRIKFLGKLKPKIYNQIINHIKNIDDGEDEATKNS